MIRRPAAGRPLPLLLLAIVSLTWQHAAAVFVTEVEAHYDESLLWRIEAPNGVISHLFGTIHSSDPRVVDLPIGLSTIIESAAVVALEIDFEPAAMLGMLAHMLLPLDQTLSDKVGSELAEQARQAMAEQGLPPLIADQLQPWAVSLMLSVPVQKDSNFLDQRLATQARQRADQTLRGLESIDEQMQVFSTLSASDQQQLLRETLTNRETIAHLQTQMINAWLAGDVTEIVRLTEHSMGLGDAALAERFMDRALWQRNRRMASRLEPLLESGGVFAAVGALHLPGDRGLVALLTAAGYRLTPLPFGDH